MRRTGLAPERDELGVRWVAVSHAADHVHIVATLVRQDGTRPKVWNDFYRVREAELRFGLRRTAPADHTAARRGTRAETRILTGADPVEARGPPHMVEVVSPCLRCEFAGRCAG